jgi:hypothetical protein
VVCRLQSAAVFIVTVLSLPLLAFGAVPSIKSLVPTSGQPGTSVTIKGNNFGATQGRSTLTFNGIAATPITWKALSIVVQVPVGTTTGSVVVTVNGISSNAAQFTVAQPPQITRLSAGSDPVGTAITIAGSNFGATQGTSSVTFNRTAAAPTSWSDSSITVAVPGGATSGPVVVTVGGVASAGVTFSVVSGPRITSLSPALAAVGSSITITGSNFGRTQGSSTMAFNGATAAPASWNSSSIVVPLPVGARTGPVTVTVAGIQSAGATLTVVPAGGPYAYSVLTGDFDNNRRPDLAIVNRCWTASDCTTGSVGVLLGNGTGTFTPVVNYPTGGTQSLMAAVGDFNGDGAQDLAVVNNCATSACLTGSVSMLLGYGDGTLQPPVNYLSGGYQSLGIAAGDFNGDGTLDLAVANNCADSACSKGGTVTVLIGKGDGTFKPAVSYASGGQGAFSVAVGDFNKDGLADLAVVNNCSSGGCSGGGTVSVLLGKGDGTFKSAVTYASGGQGAYSVAVADFNNDGKADLAVVNTCANSGCPNGGSLSVLLGNGDGTFRPAIVSASGGIYAYSMAVGDFNWDGYPDVAVTNEYSGGGDSNGGIVSVLLGKGDGTFQPPVSMSSQGMNPFSVVATNFNRNDNLNLAIANSCASATNCADGTLTLLAGFGDGTFGQLASYAASTADGQSGTGLAPPQHQVSLSWNASGSGVIGYNVYRGTQSGGPYNKINPTLDANTAFADLAVSAGQTYYYVTTAVNGSGLESGYSNEVQAPVPTP